MITENNIRSLLIDISELKGSIFTSKILHGKNGMNGCKIARILEPIIDAGVVSVWDKVFYPNSSRTRRVVYKREFEKNDIDKIMSRMVRSEDEM